MSLIDKPIDELDASDIARACADRMAEGAQFEIKASLPSKDGSSPSVLSEFARNKIAEEVVAFANTYGGTIVIGIAESVGSPSQAETPSPLPDCQELARRLRQAVHSVVEPPLPVFEARGVIMEAGDRGVVVIRVGQSRLSPHRLMPNREVYVRRGDETVRVSMREIHDLTISNLTAARRVEDEIERRRDGFRQGFSSWLSKTDDSAALAIAGCAFQFLGIAVAPLDLGRVARRNDVRPGGAKIAVKGLHEPFEWQSPSGYRWRPTLRGIVGKEEIENYASRLRAYSLGADGTCELQFFIKSENEGHTGLFAGWLISSLAAFILWIDQIRRAGNSPDVEYIVAPYITCSGAERIPLAPLGARNFGQGEDAILPMGNHPLPYLSIARVEELPEHLALFLEDVFNLAGEPMELPADNFNLV